MKVYAALPILLSTAGLLPISQAGEIVEVHGSGTTNPSKCIWHLMSLFNARSRTPIRMTYRAVGSSTGQTEFLGVNNTDPENPTTEPFQHWPHTDFGAGDIPVPSEKYNALQDSGADPSYKKMVHLPFALSSVSFFYKLNDVEEIDLSACLLAKIFNREITTWNDPELVKINPSLATKDTDIKVCRRTHGSSSTKSITKVCLLFSFFHVEFKSHSAFNTCLPFFRLMIHICSHSYKSFERTISSHIASVP
jgi:ABC-type phosphate transport system substrate-binding protein